MKVLWILNGCGLEGRGITGAPVRFHEISRRWAVMGIEQSVMTTPGGDALLTTLGSAHISRNVSRASLLLKREPCRAFRFWSYLISAVAWRFRKWPQADVIITVSDYFCDVMPAMALKRRMGAKWIAWTHHREPGPANRAGSRFTASLTYVMQEWSYRRISADADACWVLNSPGGEESVARLLELGMPENRVRRMDNGVDVQGIAAVPEPEKSVDAVLVGVRPDKGLFDIVPVWRRVQELRPGTTLMLMGGMSGESGMLEDVRRQGLDKVITVYRPESGFVTGPAYWRKLKEAHLLFAPSPREGWGIVVGEAMAAGLPVVAYDLPAYRKIYSGAYEPVTQGDREEFAEKLVSVLNDETRVSELRSRGLAAAARYDWNSIATADAGELRRMV